MSDFLATMAQSSAERAARAGPISAAQLDKPVVPLQLGAFDVIAEIKDRSPAEGGLTTQGVGRATRARQSAEGGAAAISVLTEPSRFDGSLDHLEEVAAAVPDTPVMRKDFLVDPVQVLEARRAGASGVLLIAAMLDDGQLRSMLDCAAEHGLFVLLESFDEEDLTRSSRLLDNPVDREHADAGQQRDLALIERGHILGTLQAQRQLELSFSCRQLQLIVQIDRQQIVVDVDGRLVDHFCLDLASSGLILLLTALRFATGARLLTQPSAQRQTSGDQ